MRRRDESRTRLHVGNRPRRRVIHIAPIVHHAIGKSRADRRGRADRARVVKFPRIRRLVAVIAKMLRHRDDIRQIVFVADFLNPRTFGSSGISEVTSAAREGPHTGHAQ
jgi:hypothetical protein